jgi:hypothetical protein
MNGEKTFYNQFIDNLSVRYPETARRIDIRERLSSLLVSPHVVSLPLNLSSEAEKIISAFAALRDLNPRKKELARLAPALIDPGNYSVLMSYDFHVDSSGHLRLIEINTNASMSLIGEHLYLVQKINQPYSTDFSKEIVESFRQEYRLTLPIGAGLKRVAIVDDTPLNQRLYVEFELYRELFEKNGIAAVIADPGELKFTNGQLMHGTDKIDLVYNRDTDFYLQSEKMRAIQAAYQSRAACVTPGPFDYRLLADKERLRELSDTSVFRELALSAEQKHSLEQTLIRTRDITSFASPEELWNDRKKWFFKPKRSFGGKAVYRGNAISRGTFQTVLTTGDYLVQENVPPQTFKFPGAEGEQEFKSDLRFYVYQDKIQMACARLYRGQMTNSQTEGGGFAVIEWKQN